MRLSLAPFVDFVAILFLGFTNAFSKKKKNEVKSKIETKPDSIQSYFQNKTQVTK